VHGSIALIPIFIFSNPNQLSTLLQDIKSRDWQISTAGVGLIAEGLEDIRQCLDICLRTTKGSDPLRPQFGSDIFQYADKPVSIAIPNIVRSIIEAVQIWEQRVVINKIRWQVRETSISDFFITYRLVDEELIDLLKLQLNGGFFTTSPVQIGTLTIYALFPPNPTGKRYQVQFEANNHSVLPATPSAGFASIPEMYNWIVANWSGQGSWQLGADRITGFLKPGIQTASIVILLIGTKKYTAPLPVIAPGQKWQVHLNPNSEGEIISNSFPSASALLAWLNNNWPQYGSWSVEVNAGTDGDFESTEFGDDFLSGDSASYVLVLQSETVTTAYMEAFVV
jgi:phage baseplate assembly protein W